MLDDAQACVAAQRQPVRLAWPGPASPPPPVLTTTTCASLWQLRRAPIDWTYHAAFAAVLLYDFSLICSAGWSLKPVVYLWMGLW